MTRDVLLIVREYLDHELPQVRKNALTALAVLGTEESLSELANRALTSLEAEMVARAEEEIAELPESQRNQVVRQVTAALTSPRRQRAYAVLGRLRNRGVPVDLSGVSALARLDLAREFGWRYREPVEGRFWKQRLGTAVGATALASILVSIIATTVFGARGDTAWLSVFYFSIFMVIPALSSGLSAPLVLHASRGAAIVWDSAVIACVAAAPAVAAAVSAEPHAGARSAIATAIIVAAIGARLGSAVGLGATSGPVSNFAIQTLTGWAVGSLFLTTILIAMGLQDNEVSGAVWYVGLAPLAGVSALFAIIDAKRPAARVTTPRLQRFCLYSLMIIAGTLLLAGSVRGRPVVESATELKVSPPSVNLIRVQSLPYLRDIRLTAPATLVVTFKDCPAKDAILNVRSKGAKPGPEDFFATRYSSDKREFQAGEFVLDVHRSSSSPRLEDARLFGEFARRLTGRMPQSELCAVEIEAK